MCTLWRNTVAAMVPPISAATVLIWQSSWLGLASVLFHGAGLAFMVPGLRDDRVLVIGVAEGLAAQTHPVEFVRIDVLQPHLLREHDDAEHHRDRDHCLWV
mgnify:CR=1 FL=1